MMFINFEEEMLENYLLESSKMNYYSLTYHQARILAYEYAVALNKCFSRWMNNCIAGLDWMKNFMKKHKKTFVAKTGKYESI